MVVSFAITLALILILALVVCLGALDRAEWRDRAQRAEAAYVEGEDAEQLLRDRLAELEAADAAQRDRAEQALTPEQARDLLAEVDLPQPFPGVNGGKATVFDQQKCQHCQGLHTRKCPAVSEIEYHPDGKVRRVIYWPHGGWPEDQVIWLEDVIDAAAEEDASEPA